MDFVCVCANDCSLLYSTTVTKINEKPRIPTVVFCNQLQKQKTSTGFWPGEANFITYLFETWQAMGGMGVWRRSQRSSWLPLNVLYSAGFTLKMLFLICICGETEILVIIGLISTHSIKYLGWHRPVICTGKESNYTEELAPIEKTSTWSNDQVQH